MKHIVSHTTSNDRLVLKASNRWCNHHWCDRFCCRLPGLPQSQCNMLQLSFGNFDEYSCEASGFEPDGRSNFWPWRFSTCNCEWGYDSIFGVYIGEEQWHLGNHGKATWVGHALWMIFVEGTVLSSWKRFCWLISGMLKFEEENWRAW